jgi:Fur family ferric uptake transcriptional regulator
VTRHAHDHPSSPEDWQSTLRSKGYRLTPQRELVLHAVDRLGHATPDEILGAVREESQAVNISTVYRTLELLDDLGLIRHAHLTDRAPTYHSASEHEHAHLICRECRRVISIDRSEMEAALDGLAGKRGFAPDYGHLTIFGTCAECQAKKH